MDTELRRRFLQLLSQDFAALDLRAEGVRMWNGTTTWPVKGPERWQVIKRWWLRPEAVHEP